MEYTYKEYKCLLTTNNSIVVNEKISSFGKWNGGSNDFCTNGVVYMIVGDGYFDGTVKFFNNKGNIDEASTKFFDLATNKEYSEQFKKLEAKPESKIEEPKVKRSVARKAK